MSKGIPCEACEGSGKVKCKTCEGSGKVVCPTCKGSGKGYEKCPSCHNGYNIDPDDDRRIKCSKCNGTGRIWRDTLTCEKCGGSGKVACGDCQGSGSVGCSTCHATGSVSVEEFCLSIVTESGGLLRDVVDDCPYWDEIWDAVNAGGGSGVVEYVATWGDSDEDAILECAQKSAEAGYKWGELRYGEMLFWKLNPECEKWFQKAAAQGLQPAFAYLTLIHYFGLVGKVANVDAARKTCAMMKSIQDSQFWQPEGRVKRARCDDRYLKSLLGFAKDFGEAMRYEDFLIRDGEECHYKNIFSISIP